MAKLEEVIEQFVRSSLTKPSNQFGELVLEVDHAILGKKVKNFRQDKGVKAIEVARKLGVSKVQLHFMEIGRKQWSIQSLKDYLLAVSFYLKNKKKEK
jgi:DNA-binding transcriptional regulator YiaG